MGDITTLALARKAMRKSDNEPRSPDLTIRFRSEHPKWSNLNATQKQIAEASEIQQDLGSRQIMEIPFVPSTKRHSMKSFECENERTPIYR